MVSYIRQYLIYELWCLLYYIEDNFYCIPQFPSSDKYNGIGMKTQNIDFLLVLEEHEAAIVKIQGKIQGELRYLVMLYLQQ